MPIKMANGSLSWRWLGTLNRDNPALELQNRILQVIYIEAAHIKSTVCHFS